MLLRVLLTADSAYQTLSAISINGFRRALYEVFPLTLSLVPLFVTFYLIRHRELSSLPVAVFFVLHLCAWIFLVPSVQSALGGRETESETLSAAVPPSGSFETTADDSFVVFNAKTSAPEEGGNASVAGAVFDRRISRNDVYTFDNVRISDQAVLTEAPVRMPPLLRALPGYVAPFIRAAYTASESLVPWLLCSTMTLAILGTALLRGISIWRLANVLWSGAVWLLVLFVNVAIAAAPSASLAWLPDLFRRVTPQQVLSAAANIAIFLLCLLAGMISRRAKRKPLEARGEELMLEGGAA